MTTSLYTVYNTDYFFIQIHCIGLNVPLWDLQKNTYVGSAPENCQEDISQSLPRHWRQGMIAVQNTC